MKTYINTDSPDFFTTLDKHADIFWMDDTIIPKAVQKCVTAGEKGRLALHQIELRVRDQIINLGMPPVEGRKCLDQLQQGFHTISDMTRNKVREKVVIRPFLDPRHHAPSYQQGQGLSATM